MENLKKINYKNYRHLLIQKAATLINSKMKQMIPNLQHLLKKMITIQKIYNKNLKEHQMKDFRL